MSDAIALAGVVLTASLVLALVAFTAPSTSEVADPVALQQAGTFTYSADAPAGVYDAGRAVTGQPIYRAQANTVELQLDYRVSAEQPGDLDGTYGIVARVADSTGWSRAMPLVAETPFNGHTFSALFTLDLREAQALVDRVASVTGTVPRQYTITIVADVAVQGQLAGVSVDDSLTALLEFAVTDTLITVRQDSVNDGVVATSRSSNLPATSTQPNGLSVFGLSIGVATARIGSVIGIIGATAIGAGLIVMLGRAGKAGEIERIRAGYSDRIVTIDGAPRGVAAPLFDTASFDDLSRAADASGHPILYHQQGTGHCFYVHDTAALYRYRIAGPSARARKSVDSRVEPGTRAPSYAREELAGGEARVDTSPSLERLRVR